LPKGEELDAVAYYKSLYSKMDLLEMDRKFTARSVNEGFSGGEKKRNEILQMLMLEPKICILDETDSGLDIDALKIVAKGVNAMRSPDRGMLLITHYQRLLDYIKPDHVHVMSAGKIVRSGGPELALELEAEGYEFLKDDALASA
jgi:Fe-S cluster assembly ATP-binding protein